MDEAPKHPGPHLGSLALAYATLFNLGLWFVVSVSSSPDAAHFPRPGMPGENITAYFEAHAHDVLRCAFFEFGSAIPLGLFTATVASRLQFLGVRSAGVHIALFGGFMAALDLAISALLLWVIAYPNVIDVGTEGNAVRALFYAFFALGGVGYAVPFGLLVAGVSVSAGVTKLIPKWLAILGIAIAACGESSWLALAESRLLFLVPLTRFAGFFWMIAVGFVLPVRAPQVLVSEELLPELQAPPAALAAEE